jgi:hypothetical protein
MGSHKHPEVRRQIEKHIRKMAYMMADGRKDKLT